MRLWLLGLLPLIVMPQTPSAPTAPLPSQVIDWKTLVPKETRNGERRDVFDQPTDTLDKLHLHITTLKPGENTGPLHRHPQEEMVIIREGTIEVNIDGRKQTVGSGSVVYFGVNENENMTNVGSTPAIYYVVQWYTSRTPKP